MATATQTTARQKLLIYDGDCPMCRSTVGLLLAWRIVAAEQLRSNHELAGAELEAAERAGLRNQLVVLDPASGETRQGSDALLWIARERAPLRRLAQLLGRAPARQLLRHAYQAISFNRRIISPPRHAIRCDCEPEVTVGSRMKLVVPLLVAIAAILAALGAAVAVAGEPTVPLRGATLALSSVLGGLTLLAAAGWLLPREKRLDFVGHLAVTTFAGALVLVPAVPLVLAVPRAMVAPVAACWVLAACATMFAMQRRRIAALALGRPWLWGWRAAIAAAAVGALLGLLL